MSFLSKILGGVATPPGATDGEGTVTSKLTKDQMAEILKTSPETFAAFEKAYTVHALNGPESDDVFHVNSRQASAKAHEVEDPGILDGVQVASATEMRERIVADLLSQTEVYVFDGNLGHGYQMQKPFPALPADVPAITNDAIKALPEPLRPQCTGTGAIMDIPGKDTDEALLFYYQAMTDGTRSPAERQNAYNHFRQGLDILDLSPVAYRMLGMNRNSMGHWLPALVDACKAAPAFFRIPATRIAKVPITLLQMTRLEYQSLTPQTLSIVDEWAFKAFALDEAKSYFIKTGTFSSKFDFRNCKVTSAKEVRELGEYLLYIQFQAQMMAGPLAKPTIYGASTTNEWVVREFIEDKEGNPCIYKGLPLHTEYRVFVDCDTREVIGVNPYWDPDVMLKRFGGEPDADSPHQVHDYVVYKAHEETLMRRYYQNVDAVVAHVRELLPHLKLTGQWSIDVMQNGDDFWLIDMATADTSALRECVPAGVLKRSEENWLPALLPA